MSLSLHSFKRKHYRSKINRLNIDIKSCLDNYSPSQKQLLIGKLNSLSGYLEDLNSKIQSCIWDETKENNKTLFENELDECNFYEDKIIESISYLKCSLKLEEINASESQHSLNSHVAPSSKLLEKEKNLEKSFLQDFEVTTNVNSIFFPNFPVQSEITNCTEFITVMHENLGDDFSRFEANSGNINLINKAVDENLPIIKNVILKENCNTISCEDGKDLLGTETQISNLKSLSVNSSQSNVEVDGVIVSEDSLYPFVKSSSFHKVNIYKHISCLKLMFMKRPDEVYMVFLTLLTLIHSSLDEFWDEDHVAKVKKFFSELEKRRENLIEIHETLNEVIRDLNR